MGRRTLLLIASILVALVGCALIALYVKGANDRAQSNAHLITVAIATSDIPQGTTPGQAANKGLVGTGKVIQEYYPQGALATKADVAALSPSWTALVKIPKNSVIVESDFGGATQLNTTGLAHGQLAAQVTLTDPNRVAGLVGPDSKVAVLLTVSSGSTSAKAKSRILMTDIKVLPNGTGATAAGVVTLALTSTQVEQVRLAEKIGELSLALIGSGDKGPVPDSGVGSASVLNP